MESPVVHPGYLVSAIVRGVAFTALFLVFLQQDRLHCLRFRQIYYHRHNRMPNKRQLFEASSTLSSIQYIFHGCGTALCFLSIMMCIDGDGAFGIYYFPAVILITSNNAFLMACTFFGYIYIGSKTYQAAAMGQKRFKYSELHLRNMMLFSGIFVNLFAILAVVTGRQSLIVVDGIFGLLATTAVSLWHLKTTKRIAKLMDASASVNVQASRRLFFEKSRRKWKRIGYMLIAFVPFLLSWLAVFEVIYPLQGRDRYLRVDKAQTYYEFDWTSISGPSIVFVYALLLLKHSWLSRNWKRTTRFSTSRSQVSRNTLNESKPSVDDGQSNISRNVTLMTRV